ncbi:MAG: rod shape-determining protein MreC [Pedobacter sp.]|nr:MAG: rod shape-determining protein MreC [Pedobacter sp.]
MRNLWIFISRYNAFFLFIIFFGISLILVVRNNSYQKSVTMGTTNAFVGAAYERLNILKRYINLGAANDSLALENAQLKTELLYFNGIDSTSEEKIIDTNYQEQYHIISARVIKNSTNLRNNFITINKGSASGLEKDMAVISPQQGIVGFITSVSPNFAIIRSLLNKETQISVLVKKNNAFGSLVWGDKNFDVRKAQVKEIPNHFKINVGDSIITSGAGGFPKGIFIGRVSNTAVSTGDNFMTLEINLANDFSSLQYVYVIKDRLAKELKTLSESIADEQ